MAVHSGNWLDSGPSVGDHSCATAFWSFLFPKASFIGMGLSSEIFVKVPLPVYLMNSENQL